jgi:hypothetical protein
MKTKELVALDLDAKWTPRRRISRFGLHNGLLHRSSNSFRYGAYENKRFRRFPVISFKKSMFTNCFINSFVLAKLKPVSHTRP